MPSRADVSSALRSELESRGHSVGGDTVGLRGELYVRGDGDRAAALFEFKSTAEEACVTMYQGSWLPTLPPRFAVLPVAERDEPALDMLTQAGFSVLLYEWSGEAVTFLDVEAALAKIGRHDP